MADHVDIVFDGPPGPEPARFIEVEYGALYAPPPLVRAPHRRPSWTKAHADLRSGEMPARGRTAQPPTNGLLASDRPVMLAKQPETPATTLSDTPPWRRMLQGAVTTSRLRTATSTPSIISG